MFAPIESMPIIYPNEEEMQNGNENGGDGLGQLVPIFVQPTQVEESETLVS